jgi:hypothetical protein
MDVLLSHTVPQIRLRDRAATLEHEERHVGVIPQKKYTFCHLTRWSNIKKRKYGSIPDPEQTKISTLLNTTASTSEPDRNWAWKK